MIPPTHPIFTAYLRRLDRKKVVPGTRYNAERWLGRFELWCKLNRISPEAVTPDDCDAWMAKLAKDGFSDGSIHLARIQLKAAYKYGHARGEIPLNPTYDLFSPLRDDIEPLTFTNDELRRIVHACRTERESLAIHILCYTMMRRGEVRNLKWDDVDLRHSTITVRKGKGRKLRLVPIHAALGEILAVASKDRTYVIANEHRDEPVQDTTWDQIIKPVLKRAGVKGTAHVFRKTLSSDLAEQGVADSHIDQIGGWAPRSVRERHYLRVAPDFLIAAIHKAYRNDPVSVVKQSGRRVA